MKQETTKLDIGPKKFSVWLFVVVSIMLFAAFTSAFIVRRGEGKWLHYDLPITFLFTTIVIAISSGTLHMAYLSAKRLRFETERNYLWATFFLGVLFLFGQVWAWGQLVKEGVYFTGNPSGSFLYVISGLHGLHIVAGLCLLVSALVGVYRNIGQVKNLFRLEIAAIFWHFLDILWIYLYVFLLLNQ